MRKVVSFSISGLVSPQEESLAPNSSTFRTCRGNSEMIKKNLNVICRDLHSPLIRPLPLHTLQAQTFLVSQIHGSPSHTLKDFITSPSPGKRNISLPPLPALHIEFSR